MTPSEGESETSTLLPPTPGLEPEAGRQIPPDRSRGDKPIQLESFQRNVRRGRVALGLALPIALGLDIWHVVGVVSSSGFVVGNVEGVSSIVCLAFTAITVITFIIALFRPLTFRHPCSALSDIARLGTHRAHLQGAFLCLLLAALGRWLPWLFHVFQHRVSPAAYTPVQHLRISAGLAALFATGLTRRGPLLRYDPPRLGTGFGISGDLYNSQAEEGRANVMDWDGCSMLGYATLTFNAAVAIRSTEVEQLQPYDLPFLEEKVRLAGVDTDMATDRFSTEGVVTGWQVVQTMFMPRRWIILQCMCIETIGMMFSFLQIAAMHELITTFDDPPGSDKSYAYLACMALFIGEGMETALSCLVAVKESYQLNEPIRMVFFTTNFRKILRTQDVKAMDSHHLSDEEREQCKGRSQILNLFGSDSFTVSVAGKRVWELTNAIIALTIGGAFLYALMGVSAAVGVLTIPLAAPMSYFVAKYIYRCDKVWMRTRDARTSAIKEFLDCIKVIKLNAWEPHFKRRIEHLRDVEITWQRWRYHLGTMFNILADQLPVLSLAVMFAFHTLVMKRQLDPATGFVTFTVFNRVKSALSDVPGVIQALLSTGVALGRLVDFLNQPETSHLGEDVSTRVAFDDATITWPSDIADAFRLRNVNVTLPHQGFTIICGPLGSGKTLLLRAILSEAIVEEGKVHAPRSHPDDLPVIPVERVWDLESWINESVAYAPQQPFVRHGTIRDNILFGQPMWEERYWEVMRQCGLLPDLELMPNGDMTEVGEGGVTLSGGQKARVNLARCVYSRARTVLLDDILSAVDAHTAQHIYSQCLDEPLFRSRTLILVTHQVGLCLPGADYVVSLRDGRVENACAARETMIADLEPQSPTAVAAEAEASRPVQSTTREAYTREHRAIGHVAMNHYTLVLSAAGGYMYWGFLILLVAIFRASEIARQKILADWTAQLDNAHVVHYLALFLGATAASSVFGSVRWVWLYGVGNIGMYNRGCRVLHRQLFDKIANAPLGFFDTTPKGRLMNIFGQDVFRIDSSSADDVGRGLFQVSTTITSIVMVCAFEPRMLLVIILMAFPFHFANRILRKLRADIRRLTSICYSPLASLFSDTIDGVVMIRAFGQGRIVSETLITLADQEKKAWVANWAVYQWARLVIQSMSAVVISATAFLLVNEAWTASQAGFILSFALMISSGLFSLLERASEMEQTFVSAERINEYMQMEKQEVKDGDTPPPDWPERGQVSIRDLRVRYAPDLPEVLHGLSVDISPGQRVGLVGATGSGKSTLALSLFRGNQQTGGSISIDGIDIGRLALPELRARLNMIVQESTLCSGTLRDALDISGEKDDAEVYDALRQVHLLEGNTGQFADLETFVAVEGANFSQGERQLLCLARALLKKSKILVMDEATSSVDYETDAKITTTIDECFKGTTMLVIAHRLATIINFDSVLVMDAGTLIEQGNPAKLIQDRSSRFYAMCMAQGPEEFERLRRLVD